MRGLPINIDNLGDDGGKTAHPTSNQKHQFKHLEPIKSVISVSILNSYVTITTKILLIFANNIHQN
jgi:hypothetical protein